jgi:hypothetical protein
MPSRRNNASSSPRAVQASASHRIRSFSDALKLLLDRFGVVYSSAPATALPFDAVG